MINAKDARTLAEIFRDADVFDDLEPLLDKKFPTIDWRDLVSSACPKCGRRSRLVGKKDCLHCQE